MTDILNQTVGSQMAVLKEEIACLRQRLTEADSEETKKMIRREIMEKETYYNVLSDRYKLQH